MDDKAPISSFIYFMLQSTLLISIAALRPIEIAVRHALQRHATLTPCSQCPLAHPEGHASELKHSSSSFCPCLATMVRRADPRRM
jgi:hypothetical protein